MSFNTGMFTSWLVLLILNLGLCAMVGLRETRVWYVNQGTQRKRWKSLKRSLIPMQLFPHSKSLYVFCCCCCSVFFFLIYFLFFFYLMLVSLSVSSFQSYIDRTQKNPITAIRSVFCSQTVIPVAEYSGNPGLWTSNTLTLSIFLL